ncbi:tRNA 2-selenouridine(34) synthase MnmH [uncultured Ramlibacter sp.]|uniref:tRNA 2-selenouridine(34) synthase MnmH n=1 Tax=uncultured Ramlibacter sp. TaxID=260755 RepID=UPI00262E5B0D|nr:tRNA 2-selenouridine(34) synthase MnmH [uncultured Ramlibacter sp.]
MKAPVRVADRGGFDMLIDARSPGEFAIDHIPGAINCPVLDDEERRIVGTLYKQQGAFEARRVGGAMVAANLARHLREQFGDKPANWKPLVYCWRGGLRSGSMTTWLRLVGWDAQQLAGGYKSWRRHVIDLIDALAPTLPITVVCGATGSAKTRVLHALAAQGEQVLDLEGLACHKGSLLGALPDRPQPSQTAFETQVAAALERVDPARPLYVEGESRRIGKINVPPTLVERMRASPLIEVQASFPARLEYLLRDYAYLGERPQWLSDQLGMLKEMHGKEVIAGWQAMAMAGDLRSLFAELAQRHYDPAYAKSQRAHFRQWDQRVPVATDDLTDQGIEAVARDVRALRAAPA